MIGRRGEHDRDRDEHRQLRGVEVESAPRGPDDTGRGGAAHEQEVDGPQFDLAGTREREERGRPPRSRGEQCADQARYGALDHLAPPPSAQVAHRNEEGHDVGDRYESHERQPARERHRAAEDEGEQRRRRDPEKRAAPERAHHLIETRRPGAATQGVAAHARDIGRPGPRLDERCHTLGRRHSHRPADDRNAASRRILKRTASPIAEGRLDPSEALEPVVVEHREMKLERIYLPERAAGVAPARDGKCPGLDGHARGQRRQREGFRGDAEKGRARTASNAPGTTTIGRRRSCVRRRNPSSPGRHRTPGTSPEPNARMAGRAAARDPGDRLRPAHRRPGRRHAGESQAGAVIVWVREKAGRPYLCLLVRLHRIEGAVVKHPPRP